MRNISRLFSDYFSMVTAFLLPTVAMVMGIKKIIQTYNDFEERLDNLSALTGLAEKKLSDLIEEAKRVSILYVLKIGIPVAYFQQRDS